MCKKISKYLFFRCLGRSIYYGLEILFRGFSHWSMFVLGGICFLFFYIQGRVLSFQEPLWRQILRCMIFVTAMEFLTGLIVNKWLCWEVWDYSDLPFQLFGQICLPFAIIFSGLCAIGIILSGYIAWGIYGEEKPQYHVF